MKNITPINRYCLLIFVCLSFIDFVNRAYKILEDEQTRNDALEIVDEAKFMVKKNMEEKRKKMKKEGRGRIIDEDDPIKYKHSLKIMTMKLFADYERKRRSDLERVNIFKFINKNLIENLLF